MKIILKVILLPLLLPVILLQWVLTFLTACSEIVFLLFAGVFFFTALFGLFTFTEGGNCSELLMKQQNENRRLTRIRLFSGFCYVFDGFQPGRKKVCYCRCSSL